MPNDSADRELRTELSAMKVKELKKWARELDVVVEKLEDADDADDVRATVIELIVEAVAAHPASASDHDRAAAAQQALESELSKMQVKALKKRARAVGVDEELLDDADDAEDTKTAVIGLIVAKELAPHASSVYTDRATQLRSLPPADANYRVVYAVEDSATAALRQELAGLKLKALKSRARELGVSEDALEDADDADDVRVAVTGLCIEAGTVVEAEGTALRALLTPLKLKALKKRAREVGVSADALDDADDADDIKQSVMDLIIVASQEAVTKRSAAATANVVYTPADYSAARNL